MSYYQNNVHNRFAPQGQHPQTYNSEYNTEPKPPSEHSPQPSSSNRDLNKGITPDNSHRPRRWNKIHEDGESGRKGFHPFHFLHVCWMSSNHVSMVVNVLWPVVPAAIAVVSL